MPILAAIAIGAVTARAAPLLAGGGLHGLLGYDEGVYFGSAVALVHGSLPYRDFLLLHPPGMVALLTPFALVGNLIGDANAFALARMAVTLLGASNAVLAALVAGRFDRRAGILAGIVYAVWSTASNYERSTDLHAPQSTLVLLALMVLARPARVRPRRAVPIGTLLGVATAIQLWQAVTVTVVLGWILVRASDRGLGRFRPVIACGAAAVGAFGLVCLPFLAAAPEAMIRYVLVDQAGRPRVGAPLVERLRALEGLPRLAQLPRQLRNLVPDALVLTSATGVFVLAAITAVRRPWVRPWLILTIAQTAVVLVMPSFFNDYAALIAAAASLVLGTALAEVLGIAERGRWSRRAIRAAVAVTLLGLLAVSVARLEGTRLPLRDLEADVTGAGCVSADHPAVLVLTSALRRDLERGCSIVLDPTGVRYDTDRGRLTPGRHDQERREAVGYQRAMVEWYGGSDLALFIRDGNGLNDNSRATIEQKLPYHHRHGAVKVRSTRP